MSHKSFGEARGGERGPAGEVKGGRQAQPCVRSRTGLTSGEVANQTLEPARRHPTAAAVAITTCRLLLLIAARACAAAAIRRVAHTCAALALLLVGCVHARSPLWAPPACLCRR